MQFRSPQAKQDWLAAKAVTADPHLFGCAETWAHALELRGAEVPMEAVALATVSHLLLDPTPARVHMVVGMLRHAWHHGEELHHWCSTHMLLA